MMATAYIASVLGLVLAWKMHDRYDPARYFAGFWGLQILLIATLFYTTFGFNGRGLTYIAGMGLVFSAGSVLGRGMGKNLTVKASKGVFRPKWALRLLQFGFLMAVLHLLEGLWVNGYAFGDLVDGEALLRLNDAASDNRYLSPLPVSLWSRVTLVFLYVTPLYGGYLLPLLVGKKRIWTYVTLLPSLLMALTLSVKSTFITSVVLWGIGVLVSAYANNRGFMKVGKGTILKWTAAGMLFLVVLFLSMVLRTGRFDRASVRETEQKIVVYACGHLPAFDAWFQDHVGHLKPTWGVKTFYGLSGPLGLAKREQGVFTDYVVLGKQQGKPVPHLMDTNVYTLFRFLLEDFGLLGSAVFILLAGMLAGFSWLQVKKRPDNPLFQVVLMAILFTIAWSFVGSVWAYTSYMLTMLLMLGLIKLTFAR